MKNFVLNDNEKYNEDIDSFKKLNTLKNKLHLLDAEQARKELSMFLPGKIPYSKYKNSADSSKTHNLKLKISIIY